MKAKVTASLIRAIVAGAWRFAVVSVGGFAIWAFWGRWFYARVGEAGLYGVTALVFLGLAGVLLYPLVPAPNRVARIYRVFVPAFLGYAAAWCAMWFLFGAGLGEWLGSLAGSVAFVVLCGWMFGNPRSVIGASVVLFMTHSAGYFVGGLAMAWVMRSHDGGLLSAMPADLVGVIGKLSWGLFYGLGFGAGLGYTFHVGQRGSKPPMDL